MYSKQVMDHIANPRNVGEMADADGKGMAGNRVDGDLVLVFIKVDEDRITKATFQTAGCGAAIACGSMTTEMATGKTLEEARALTREMVANALGGLPPGKLDCSTLAADALRNAIDDYRSRL